MSVCVLCNEHPIEDWFGYLCPDCKKISGIIKIYGLTRVSTILDRCCIRSIKQLEEKMKVTKM